MLRTQRAASKQVARIVVPSLDDLRSQETPMMVQYDKIQQSKEVREDQIIESYLNS